MPRVRILWRDVWAGAAVTALLFAIGKFLIGLYIGKSAISSGFGAAGSLVVVLVWVYYSAQIFLLGAGIYPGLFPGARFAEEATVAGGGSRCRRKQRGCASPDLKECYETTQ